MTQPRPTLATAICIYEALAGLYILGGFMFSQFIFYAVEPGAHRLMLNPTHAAFTLLAALLSFAIALTFWFLRREAFFLVLLKLLLSLFNIASLVYVLSNGRAHGSISQFSSTVGVFVFWLPRFFDVMFLLITAAIAVYVYRLTLATASTPEPGATA